MGALGAIPPLIALSASSNVHSQCLALAALRRLSTNPHNRSRLVAAGVLQSLASAGSSAEVEVQREVAATLCNVSLDEDVRVECAQMCMVAIVDLSLSGDVEVSAGWCGSRGGRGVPQGRAPVGFAVAVAVAVAAVCLCGAARPPSGVDGPPDGAAAAARVFFFFFKRSMPRRGPALEKKEQDETPKT